MSSTPASSGGVELRLVSLGSHLRRVTLLLGVRNLRRYELWRHLQDAGGGKYLYDFDAGEFVGLPSSLAKQVANDPNVARAVAKGRRYLGLGD